MTENTTASASPGNAELERLASLVGTWETKGTSYAEGGSDQSLTPANVDFLTTETFAWLPGGHFLTHHWDGTVGGAGFAGMEILGLDEETGGYVSHFFDNQGNHPVYQVSENNGTWTYTGDLQRATHVMNAAGDTLTIHWDWSRDGKSWKPLCDLNSVKQS